MSQEKLKRLYSAKDTVMLTVLSIILKNALANIAELTEENENWNVRAITALLTRIENALENILGIDPKKDQREATALVKQIQAEALPILSTLALRMGVAVKNTARKTELLKQLGFTEFAAKAQQMDQIALIEFLAKFKTNATNAVKAEITASKDIKIAAVDKLIDLSKTLVDNHVNQETYKDTSKVITADGVTELNAIYTAVVKDFSKLVLDFYKKKKSNKANLFSFAAILKTVNGSGNHTPPPPTEPK
ncbi:MAG: hypothetical protein QM541_06535 [Flavobacterium sp.]|nr:hypothetical protein [Flavobacterium sp.]